MMNTPIDLTAETPLTLREATKLPQLRRNGRAPHIASIYRWATVGCRGLTLATVVIAGSRCTTSAAIDRWIAALTAAAGGQPTPVRTPVRRRRDHERANETLEKSGW
jgi:hypothetical protein